jgi:hypothetical protein
LKIVPRNAFVGSVVTTNFWLKMEP